MKSDSVSTVTPDLSVVIPVLNERGNIGPLIDEIHTALSGRAKYEIIVVDDGSSDGTGDEVREAMAGNPGVHLVSHERTRGQSAAIRTGVQAANAPIVGVLDGDGQNDPADLPALFDRLRNADDLRMVVGQRVGRQDTWVRKFSSRVANTVRNALLHDGITDTGCGLKVFYRADFLRLPAFDHMHRFLPALVQRDGGKIDCVDVSHRPRVRGDSKYGIGNRLWVGITDLFGVMWLQRRRL
jgi:dolichol-phosphate mannosyltransferase